MKLGKRLFVLPFLSLAAAAMVAGGAGKQFVGAQAEGIEYHIGDETYVLSEEVEEYDLSLEGALTSRWGRQAATLTFDQGVNKVVAFQPINGVKTLGSYHTKFDLTFQTPSANWFNMMLRQNSGENPDAYATTADGTIDIGPRNGFELFTADNGFQVFYNVNGERTAIGWFAYDATNRWAEENRTYTFEIWMLNLNDGSVQINIDTNGTRSFTFNTSSKATELAGKEIIKTGSMRFAGEFDNLSSMAWTLKGYGAYVFEKDTYELEDSLTEWDISKDLAIASRWGNQAATVVYENGKYISQSQQPINGLKTMGSYHTKFDLEYHNDGGNAFNMMLRQNSGTLTPTNGGEGLADIGTRTGYEIFTSDNGFQFFYNENNARTALNPGWFAYDTTSHFAGDGTIYTFEIWVLNLKDGTVQIILNVNGDTKLNYNSANDPAITPIKTGSVRMCGSFDDLLGKGVTLQGYELNADAYPYTISGDLPTTVEVLEEVNFGNTALKTEYAAFYTLSKLSGSASTRQLGETDLFLDVPGGKVEKINVVATEGATYAIKEGYKAEYLVNDTFADDLVLVKTVGENKKEVAVLASEVSGFDSSTNGVKELTVSLAGQQLKVSIRVIEYVISEESKVEYVLDETYVDGDIVLNTVCGDDVVATEITSDDITSFDTSALGTATITFVKFDKEFTHVINVVESQTDTSESEPGDTSESEPVTPGDSSEEQPAKKGGCGGSIIGTSVVLSLLSLAGVTVLALRKRV